MKTKISIRASTTAFLRLRPFENSVQFPIVDTVLQMWHRERSAIEKLAQFKAPFLYSHAKEPFFNAFISQF